MKLLSDEAVRLAEDYLLRHARILERRRFDHLFGGGAVEPVVAALVPYRNEDGGFGHALEPDGRGPGSQPVTVLAALGILDEVGAFASDLVPGACDYLVSISADDGGVPFVHPNIRDHPRAPWWEIPAGYAGSLVPTGSLAGLLHKNMVSHPWLGPATEFCWRRIEALTATSPYEAFAALQFLNNVADRPRAEAAAARLGALVREGGHVVLPSGTGSLPDGHDYFPNDYAPAPEGLARQWFSDAELASAMDSLEMSQQDDGSWPVRWGIWTPATAHEWGGWVTIEALKTLRAYGRLPARAVS